MAKRVHFILNFASQKNKGRKKEQRTDESLKHTLNKRSQAQKVTYFMVPFYIIYPDYANSERKKAD